jgi:hypothetical protein
MANMFFDIEGEGFEIASTWLRGVSLRVLDHSPAYETMIRVLEGAEQELFNSLGGRYVDTGRTLESLTQSGSPDAIRKIHDNELDFGTEVPYAVFLNDPPILVLHDVEEQSAAERIMQFIVGEHVE